jgi:hypothetical protein
MKSVAGIFTSREEAERAARELERVGIARDRITVLSPGASQQEIASVPTDEGEQPGTGAAIGAVVGGAVGAAGGMPIGAALLSLVVPGIGPVIASGIIGAALLGAGGAAIGSGLERSLTEGLPKDELFVYEDALRGGRSVVITLVDDDADEAARSVFEAANAEMVDAAREQWWIGLRAAEAAQYTPSEEAAFRRGFEAALHRDARGLPIDEAMPELRRRYPDLIGGPAFRRGYERGQVYYLTMTGEMRERLRKSA